MAPFPSNEQELLEACVTTSRALIGEFSSSISDDTRELYALAGEYARVHGLQSPKDQDDQGGK